MHAMGIDDAYRVERVLAETPAGTTECVTLSGAGPFVRKRIPSHLANRGVWAALAACRCPRLPQVAATYEMPDQFVVVYDYVAGVALGHAVEARGRLSAEDASATVREVCEAVSELHAHGIIHRDITPSNIIIAADGAHLIDYGIARLAGQDAPRDEKPLGTWGFAAPEQYGFAPTDARSDIYALGRLLGYALTGVSPDDDSYDGLLASEDVVPPALRSVVERACAFEPSARYQDAGELSAALAEAEAFGGGVSARPGDSAASSSAGCAAVSSPIASGVSPQAEKGGFPSSSGPCQQPHTQQSLSAVLSDASPRRRTVFLAVGAALLVVVVATGSLWAAFHGFPGYGVIADALGIGAVLPDDSGEGAPLSPDAGASAAGGDSHDASTRSGALGSGSAAAGGIKGEGLLEVVESGWSVDAHGYVCYGVGIRNASSEFDVMYPEVSIVGRNAEGDVLFSDQQTLFAAFAGQAVYFGGIAGNGTAPASVEFSVVAPESFNVSEKAVQAPVLRVGEISSTPDGFGGTAFTGEVALEEGDYLDAGSGDVAVSVILRDEQGAIVYGATNFVSRPSKGKNVAFEVDGYTGSVPAYATVEAYAQPW